MKLKKAHKRFSEGVMAVNNQINCRCVRDQGEANLVLLSSGSNVEDGSGREKGAWLPCQPSVFTGYHRTLRYTGWEHANELLTVFLQNRGTLNEDSELPQLAYCTKFSWFYLSVLQGDVLLLVTVYCTTLSLSCQMADNAKLLNYPQSASALRAPGS